MNRLIHFTGLCAAALCTVFSTSVHAQTSFVASRAALAGNDTIDWSQYLTTGTAIPNPDIAVSNNLVDVTVAKSVPGSASYQIQGTTWNGNFSAGDDLYDTGDNAGGINPITFSGFSGSTVCRLGMNVQAGAGGAFMARIEGFDAGGASLGFHDVGGFSDSSNDGSAVFAGISSADPMTTVAISVIQATLLSQRYAINEVDFTLCDDLEPQEILSKKLVGGGDLAVEIAPSEPLEYSFDIVYTGDDPVQIRDTVPADWDVALGDPNNLGCTLESANGKDNGKGASKIVCNADGPGGSVFDAATRCPGQSGKCRPTSCGALYLNAGALAYDPNDLDGGPLHGSNTLCLVAVEDLNGGGIVGDGSGDEDGDNLGDHAEACDLGLDPCDPDSDGDGVQDDVDQCPLEGPPGVDEVSVDGCNEPSP